MFCKEGILAQHSGDKCQMQNAIVGVCATRSEGKQIYHVSRDFIPARFFSFHEVVRVVDIPVVSLGE